MAKPGLSNNSKTDKGLYDIKNVDKYLGNPTNCIFRSSWELRFMVYLDHLDAAHKWASETVEIPYYLPNPDGAFGLHRYFPDFYVEFIRAGEEEYYERVFIEIKPSTSVNPPFVKWHDDGSFHIDPPLSRSAKAHENFEYQLKEFQKNLIKWETAKTWCEKRGMIFMVMTEHDLIAKNIMPPLKNFRRKKWN
jgi:hypothetical protein